MGAMISNSNTISLNDIRVALQTNLEVKNFWSFVNSGQFTSRKSKISLDDFDVKSILFFGWVHNGNDDTNTWSQNSFSNIFTTPPPSRSLSQFKGKGLKGTDNYLYSYTTTYYT